MKKEITMGQLLSVGATLLIAIITGWVTLNNEVSFHESEIVQLQKKQDKTEVILDKIDNKLEQILIKMENKKDR